MFTMSSDVAFIDIIKGIDWDLLHEQKYELLAVIEKEEKISGKVGKLEGLVNLIDELQDVADEYGVWKFPKNEEEKED